MFLQKLPGKQGRIDKYRSFGAVGQQKYEQVGLSFFAGDHDRGAAVIVAHVYVCSLADQFPGFFETAVFASKQQSRLSFVIFGFQPMFQQSFHILFRYFSVSHCRCFPLIWIKLNFIRKQRLLSIVDAEIAGDEDHQRRQKGDHQKAFPD